MKTRQAGRSNLTQSGRENLEKTSEFKKKVEEIKKELTDKYSLTLLNEKNWVKRLFVKLRLQIEIRKRVNELSSWRNLHILNH